MVVMNKVCTIKQMQAGGHNENPDFMNILQRVEGLNIVKSLGKE
jgi:hypothetical protein